MEPESISSGKILWPEKENHYCFPKKGRIFEHVQKKMKCLVFLFSISLKPVHRDAMLTLGCKAKRQVSADACLAVGKLLVSMCQRGLAHVLTQRDHWVKHGIFISKRAETVVDEYCITKASFTRLPGYSSLLCQTRIFQFCTLQRTHRPVMWILAVL